MGTFKTLLKLVSIIFGTVFSLLLWVLSSISEFFKNQIMFISTEMRKDESNAQTTINPAEIDLFSRLTDWWDPNGSLKGLHNMNLVRIPFITNGLSKGTTERNDKPLKGIKILDVGCGGGFLSEPLARMGAIVTGIDCSKALIDIADAHKHLDPELEDNKPTYIATTVEEHIEKCNSYYDALIASEVIDHVSNPEFFVKSCIQAVKPGGKIFFTAPNRTWITRFGLIFYPENVSNLLPKGTHHYENFITPKELSAILEKNNCRVDAMQVSILYTTYMHIKQSMRYCVSARSSVVMGTYKKMLSVVLTTSGNVFSVSLWAIYRIVDFFKNQTNYTSKKIRKDEINARTTINPAEVELFSLQSDWWDPNGSCKGLHSMNSVRIPFIKDALVKDTTEINNKPLKDIKILDIGCGGGLLSEPLAKLGATVTGIDPCEELIDIAEAHKLLDPELDNNKPTYIATTVEEHITQFSNYYDAVIASEVIDHISNPEFFVNSCTKAMKPGGTIFFTAPNRTWLSRFGVIFFAENVAKILPKGTHHYENFVTPEELSAMLEKNNCRVETVRGFFYNFLNNTWLFVKPLHLLYGLQATKIN
ncbi:hypothetical protein K1T71_001393 [Dendrolimus kikuchii]|uniref:Uncharacterized protein n=1 Tax=Dendrolimus kikuchii TaxID=765133 RepID=A0ACC1DII0_9NEOP|nr:hypothetical protein K1T71_001393 [Dendrolimus kikuchii]